MPSPKKSTSCPYCQARMRPVVMACPLCETEVRAEFRQALFQNLMAEDLELLEKYLLADFSIKELAKRTGMGYTALRSRLDRLIGRYRDLRSGEEEKRQILDQVAAGELPAAEAAKRIAKIGG